MQEQSFDPAVWLLNQFGPVMKMFGTHTYLLALALLVATVVVAKIVNKLMVVVLRRIAKRSRNSIDDRIVVLLQQPVFISVMLLGLAMVALVLSLSEHLHTFTLPVLRSIAVVVWTLFLLRVARMLLKEMASQDRFPLVRLQTLPLFQNIFTVLIVGLAIYAVFLVWHIDMSAWLASAGILGIVVGLAAKDTMANLFSGVFIMADAPYKIGDYIVLDSGERGEVTSIGIRSTRLLTRDDVEVTIPNAIMGNTKIINESGGPWEKFRVRVVVGVAYGSDIDQVKQVLLEIAGGQPDVCANPEPRVRFRGFGASSLDLELLCWVDQPVLRGRILDLLYTEIYKAFQSRHIEIPYSKQDLYIKELPR